MTSGSRDERKREREQELEGSWGGGKVDGYKKTVSVPLDAQLGLQAALRELQRETNRGGGGGRNGAVRREREGEGVAHAEAHRLPHTPST